MKTIKTEILNDKFEQCPNCKSFDSKRYSGILKNKVMICLDCKCQWWRKSIK